MTAGACCHTGKRAPASNSLPHERQPDVIHRRKRLTTLDAVLGFIILAVAVYVYYRIDQVVHYRWEWSAIPQYLFRYDAESGRWVTNLLMQGFFTTIRLSVWGTLLAMIIGTAMGLFRVSHSLFLRLVGRTYVESIRNLPPLVLIFIFYFFVSDQIMPVLRIPDLVAAMSENQQAVLTVLLAPPNQVPAFLSALVTLAIFEGAYITEIVRAGIQSIGVGQWEASKALGFTRWQQMRHIILPRAFQRVLPPLSGQFISTIKDSAIVSVISIQELTFQGMELMSATYLTFEIWITITIMYLALTLPCSLLIQRIEVALRTERMG
jgi:polar amino acid transport system permease protein